MSQHPVQVEIDRESEIAVSASETPVANPLSVDDADDSAASEKKDWSACADVNQADSGAVDSVECSSKFGVPAGWPVVRIVPVETRHGREARVRIQTYPMGGPTPFSVDYELKIAAGGETPDFLLWEEGPESDLSEVLSESLARLLENEAAVCGQASMLDAFNEINIAAPHFDGSVNCRVRCRLERHEDTPASHRDWTLTVVQLMIFSCPGQPGYYKAPAALRAAALAMAISARVNHHAQLKESGKLDFRAQN